MTPEGPVRQTGPGVRLAVLGDPIAHSRSPVLHRAGCAALGLACESVALRTPLDALHTTLDRLAAEGFTGCNLTMPLKAAALGWVREASPAARRARSVNTITFAPAGARGDTTDGDGFLDLLRALDRDPARARVTLLGSGGSARSLAVALAEHGRGAHVVSRRAPGTDPDWGEVRIASFSTWGSPEARSELAAADVVVNCTPLGAADSPAPPEALGRNALVVDLTYGDDVTAWVKQARASGREAVDGLGLLVHQAHRSLAIWLERDLPLSALATAVGWPR